MKIVFGILVLIFVQNIEASPLFEGSFDQPLLVEIRTDLQKIKHQRSDFHTSTDNYIHGKFLVHGREFDIRLQTRGHNRLKNCSFPPLRVNFEKSAVKNTFLKYNHNLKIVTHCQDDKLQMLFREHWIYKAYNLITPYSFHVRLLKVKYIDVNGSEDTIESYALFLESSNSVEERLDLVELESDDDFNLKTYKDLSENWLNISQVKLHDAFQNLILNKDWVIFYFEPTSTFSAANIKFFYRENEGYPFPYDFDLAGLVTGDTENYQYQYSDEYPCNDAEMGEAFGIILDHQDEYIRLLEGNSLLTSNYKKKTTEYLNRFQSEGDFCL
jgi:hypothetical protein